MSCLRMCYVQLVCDKANLFASGCAAGRAFPLYNMKTGDCSQADASGEAGESCLLYIPPNAEDAPLSGEEAHALNFAIKGTRTTLHHFCTSWVQVDQVVVHVQNCIVWTVSCNSVHVSVCTGCVVGSLVLAVSVGVVFMYSNSFMGIGWSGRFIFQRGP